MKKALIILSVLAVLIVVGFCLVYFIWTPQNMNAWGDDALADGRLAKAVSWYERAVEADPRNEAYILDLVNANIADMNYTQAERNLVSGINTAPTAALYAKLSSVYVLQDKLVDAQRLLDTVPDAAIRAQLDAMRPAMPAVSPEGGEYNELVSVTIDSDAAVYYSLTESYPSNQALPYREPIVLSAGTNRLQALAISEEGLVSPLCDTSYLLVGVVQQIDFVSSELEAMIHQMLYIPEAEPIMSSDLWQITELDIPVEVKNYADLAHFENLNTLSIHGSVVEDYSFMANLFNLHTLDVSGSHISDDALKYIGLLPSLEHLDLSNCGRSDITALSSAENLVTLNLANNSLRDITALEGLEKLEVLNLEGNAVAYLESLGKMSALTDLNIAKNNLASLDPLESSTGLVKLIADNNQLMDVSVLLSMPKLEHFTAANNRIPDVSYLSACTQMTHLDLANNRLTAIDAIASMPELAYVDISNNSITALPELPKMENLQHFYASYNQLTAIDMLAEQPLLAYVNIDYNPELEDVSCLSTCSMLVKVDIFGTKVGDIQTLRDMSVIVNYYPEALIEAQENDD